MLTESEINRLLKGRQIIEEYERDYGTLFDEAKEKALKGLNDLGFQSFDEFFEFNERANWIVLVESIKLEGECDGCIGLPYRNCERTWPAYNGDYTKCIEFAKSSRVRVKEITGVDYISDGFYRLSYGHLMYKFKKLGISINEFFDENNVMKQQYRTCPLGRGFTAVKIKDVPYDLWWPQWQR